MDLYYIWPLELFGALPRCLGEVLAFQMREDLWLHAINIDIFSYFSGNALDFQLKEFSVNIITANFLDLALIEIKPHCRPC